MKPVISPLTEAGAFCLPSITTGCKRASGGTEARGVLALAVHLLRPVFLFVMLNDA